MRTMATLALVALAACVTKDSKKKEARDIDPAWVQSHVLRQAPQLSSRIDAKFGGGKLVYLGNEVNPTTVKPGDKVTVHHYWQVVEPPGEGWKIFTHLQGTKPQDWTNVDDSDLRVGYPAARWQAGDVLHDEHKFTIDKDWQSPYVDVLVGVYPRGKNAINDRMEISGGVVDDQRRLRVARLEVDVGEVPWDHVVRKATGPITIDGKANEPDWQLARESPDFTAAGGGPALRGRTAARLLWDDQYLYAFVTAEDPDVANQYKAPDSDMWKEDVVELFIDADGSGGGYVELQVNPHNAHFDAWFATTRRQKSNLEWSAGMKSAVTVRGTLDQRGDTDAGWDVEIAIPLAAVKGMDATMAINLPPQVGDMWRLNVVRSDKPDKGGIIAASWSPLSYQDFHALDKMLTVAFGDTDGRAPVPEPETAAPVQPARPAGTRPPETSGGVPSTESAGVPSTESAGVPSPEESSGGVPEAPAEPAKPPVLRPRRLPAPADPSTGPAAPGAPGVPGTPGTPPR